MSMMMMTCLKHYHKTALTNTLRRGLSTAIVISGRNKTIDEWSSHTTPSIQIKYCYNTNQQTHKQKKRKCSSSMSFSTTATQTSDIPAQAAIKKLPQGFLEELSNIQNMTTNTNTYELDRHGHGESYHPSAPPSCIILPSTTDAVSSILRICSKYKIPVIPFGQGTSVEGHVNAIHGGISLDMSLMDDIEMPSTETDVLLEDMMISVGAGVRRKRLNEELRHTGLQFMVDPGADASIGGMVACGASGTSAVKYGTMKDNILALQAVLPSGEVIHCGSKALKSSAGYDLTRLLCGSEGTLAVITKVTLKLHPIPDHVAAIVISFPTLYEAASAVTAMRQLAIPIDRCELLDSLSITAFNRYNNQAAEDTMPVLPHLFLEVSALSQSSLSTQVQTIQELLCDHSTATTTNTIQIKYNDQERRKLWAARHQLYYAAIALRPGATSAIVTDVCVPLSRFALILQETVEFIQTLNVIGPCFGHAGDGNFHCIFPVLNNDDDDYIQRIHKVCDMTIHRAIEVGGTCTGEHGVGYGKIKYLEMQYGKETVHLMRIIKKAIDPLNIMNPGKIISIQ